MAERNDAAPAAFSRRVRDKLQPPPDGVAEYYFAASKQRGSIWYDAHWTLNIPQKDIGAGYEKGLWHRRS
jgi:hypothetical protein